jgi:ADP-ribose pyrophosphatase YjhB (NUDIX family)
MYPVSIKGVLFAPSGDVVLALNDREEWELPGGRLEIGETPDLCVAREFQEELSVSVEAASLLDAYLFEVIPGKHVFIVTYGCKLTGPFKPEVSHEHREIGLFAPERLPVNLPSGYRLSIQSWKGAA